MNISRYNMYLYLWTYVDIVSEDINLHLCYRTKTELVGIA